MTATLKHRSESVPDKSIQPNATGSRPAIDPNAPAGAKNSLGAESIRDGRPTTSDEVVEAKDELGPNPE